MAGHKGSRNFQPRNRGQLEDAQDRAAAELSRERSEAALAPDVNPGPVEETPWEASVERGEEWEDRAVPEREARGDEEPDSEVSRRGLVNPPPED
ncbi:hypothetical protein OV208_37925 [Corallococcus sp. bb12-1]|uniref:hypothetical protein n=1 Tax=Corallococcus sp. bb12-1 TaxID=2996784 RepID=UPI0022720797|nr:hypothetical protein [Corallococcus sp. bb12-1]MCY1047143.1 hypothetical protein [Corallococcus sp. bb12-1]